MTKAFTLIILALLATCLGVVLLLRSPAPYVGPAALPTSLARSPQPVGQPNPDLFDCCDQYNYSKVDLLNTGVWDWRYTVSQGCVDTGNSIYKATVDALNTISSTVGVYMDFDFSSPHVINVDCGVDFVAWCSSLSGVAACLNHQYPTNVQIDVNSSIYNYVYESLVAVLLHELMHAMLTWNEQYCYTGPCAATITCVPGYVDFMNCGPDSRHRFMQAEIARWDRTVDPSLVGYGTGKNDAGNYVFWCGPDARARWIAILAYNARTGGYRWTGVRVVVQRDSKDRPLLDSNGCQGFLIDQYLQPGEMPCLNPENGASTIIGRRDVCIPLS